MRKMSNNILSSLASVQRGSNETTERVHRHMNKFEGAERLKMRNICLPKGTRGEPPRVHSRVGLREERDTGLARFYYLAGLFTRYGEFLPKGLSIKMMECMCLLSLFIRRRGGRGEEGGHGQDG